MDANRRRRSRVATHFTVSFTPLNRPPVTLVTRNISLKGLLAEPDSTLAAGDTGLLRISLGAGASIEIECRVIRNAASGAALDFLPMDADSFFHLRNLVRYNAEDADDIDAELNRPAF
jgi:hypothetical protein